MSRDARHTVVVRLAEDEAAMLNRYLSSPAGNADEGWTPKEASALMRGIAHLQSAIEYHKENPPHAVPARPSAS